MQPVRAIDVAAGQTAHINVTVSANPPPHTEWIIAGERIEQGVQHGRFEAHEPIGVGNGIYNVTLSIIELQPEDAAIQYELKAANEYGEQQYLVQISATQPLTNAGGLVQGQRTFELSALLVAFAVISALLVLALLAVARITGRCCFGPGGGEADEEITQEKV